MASRPDYGIKTTGSEVAQAFADRIRGKTILVTGVSPKSIGGATALNIASQGPGLLILASRTEARLQKVSTQIAEKYPDAKVATLILDLGSQQSVRKAAADIAALTDRLDILINNAAAMVTSRQTTPEGIELQFATNHIGPFLLTNLLRPLLQRAAESNPAGATRVVNVSSEGHRMSPFRFSDYNLEGKQVPPEEDHVKPLQGAFAKCTPDGYNGVVAYCQSKTANILFTLYLQQHLPKFGIAAYSLHPGTIQTDLIRHQVDELAAQIAAQVYKTTTHWKSHDEGSSTTLVAALDPALDDVKELYLVDCQPAECEPHARDPGSADRLWKLSEGLVGERFVLET